MALMMGALYDALKSANVDDEKARKAAEEVASFEQRITAIAGDLSIVKWMVMRPPLLWAGSRNVNGPAVTPAPIAAAIRQPC